MPKTYKLTWNAKQRRWFKKYKGKQFAFGYGPQSTKESSYGQALADWLKKKTELDALDEKPESPPDFGRFKIRSYYQGQLEAAQSLQAFHQSNGNDEASLNCSATVATLRGMLESDNLPAVLSPALQVESFAQPDLPETVPVEDRIDANITAYLLRQKQRGVVPLRVDNDNRQLQDFAGWYGADKPVKSINAIALERYHGHLLELCDKKSISRRYAKDRIDVVRAFIRWLWSREQIDLPRNLDGLSIKAPVKAVKTMPLDELKTLLGKANESVKLYLLLMLNCGMTQSDIAKLRQDEVDWKAGRIRRKRSKTSDHENVPIVDYPLWPETFRLLQKLRSNHAELALTNQNGLALKRDSLGQDGKYKRTCNITSAYWRLAKPLGIKSPPKLLRKTAASKLGEHDAYGRYAQHFLGHSPRTIADKHYVAPAAKQFDSAVRWLGKQFGF